MGRVPEANIVASDYEAQMLKVFVSKPEKFTWYRSAFQKYTVNGRERLAWNWSWWAFFGGVFYLLYRKAPLAALGLFLLSAVISFIPFGGLIIWIASGGLSPYLVYRTYRHMKAEIEASIENEQKRVETMRAVGGYNTLAIWVGAVIMTLSFCVFIVLFLVASSLHEIR